MRKPHCKIYQQIWSSCLQSIKNSTSHHEIVWFLTPSEKLPWEVPTICIWFLVTSKNSWKTRKSHYNKIVDWFGPLIFIWSDFHHPSIQTFDSWFHFWSASPCPDISSHMPLFSNNLLEMLRNARKTHVKEVIDRFHSWVHEQAYQSDQQHSNRSELHHPSMKSFDSWVHQQASFKSFPNICN